MAGGYLQDAMVESGTGQMEAAAAVAHVAAQGGPFRGTLLALQLAPPPHRIRHPLQDPLRLIHLLSMCVSVCHRSVCVATERQDDETWHKANSDDCPCRQHTKAALVDILVH